MITSGTITYPANVGTWVREASDLQDCRIIVNSAITYECRYCGDIALYYVNAYGGWDAFLIEGVCKKVDNLTEYTLNRSFDNTTIQFEKKRYMVEINPSWELHTGWLTDEESERLARHLISSPTVYMHNLKEDKIIPVNITNTTAEYKTFKNNEKKMIGFTITVQQSQTRIRR